jgi:hypothetical protein
MGDRAGIFRSLRQVVAVGKANHWSWMERYYSEKTGDLGQYHFQYYCEYTAPGQGVGNEDRQALSTRIAGATP